MPIGGAPEGRATLRQSLSAIIGGPLGRVAGKPCPDATEEHRDHVTASGGGLERAGGIEPPTFSLGS